MAEISLKLRAISSFAKMFSTIYNKKKIIDRDFPNIFIDVMKVICCKVTC